MRKAPDPVVAHCRERIRRGSKSFAGAARLFAPRTREAAYLLYAWCRHCDDEIDAQTLGHRDGRALGAREQQRERLARLRERTERTLAGDPGDEPAFVALGRVVARYGIPHRYPLELLEGFALDVDARRYATLPDLAVYCYHVAGVVGVMMSYVMGVDDETVRRRACDLGLALQMTNIARDVLDDARCGRVYLPLEWLAQAGLEPQDLLVESHRGALAGVVARLLDEAERYYASGEVGLRALGLRSAWAIATASGVYSDIGRLVRQRGPAAWDTRAVVPTRRKLYRVAHGLLRALSAVTLGRLLPTPPRAGLWEGR